ncbi:SDR family NAD(P)-dependent oxidoreductase [Arthrobacter sp. NPDC089319]|uniref:SDR family NAD(P)-dependent oxidoreductase n=1 Tax=Arthrobacter sp. NPDC089319 TaxID=3155915 RepID=UPI0034401F98
MSQIHRGKTALVTGAHQGIGRAVALRLAEDGAHVLCADLGNCRETVTAIQDAGGSSEALSLDVTNESNWASVLNSRQSGDDVSILVNVAGVLAKGPDTLEEISDSDWDLVMGVNVRGAVNGMRAVAPRMVAAEWGRIINISSMAALKGQPGLLAYSASKGAVVGLTQQTAVEYAHTGVTVNAIAPGVTETPILAGMSEESRLSYSANHAIKRLAQPRELAALISYLAGDDAAFVTGQTISIDGGATIS